MAEGPGPARGPGEAPVDVERAGDTVWCTLARPPLNLLEPGIIEALRGAFLALAGDPSVRVAVITGSGRGFTAGMDVRVLRDLDVPRASALITALHDAIAAVHAAPFPVIAAVHGACLGAGFELALACDLRVAAADARFGLPEVRVGIPSVIHAALLPGLVGPGRAAEILLTGEPIDAGEALAWGLVNRVVPPGDLRAAARDLAARILAGAPGAIRAQKELMVRWRHADLATAVRYGIPAFATACASGELREGATAFLEKRPSRYDRGASTAAP
jgi:enoyl-CoA hydratase/carnithine racemase